MNKNPVSAADWIEGVCTLGRIYAAVAPQAFATMLRLPVSLALATCICWAQPDPGCLPSQGWPSQHNQTSDPTGLHNIYYPEIKATFWTNSISSPAAVTLHGTFPAARAMSIGIYNSAGQVIGYLQDSEIDPDIGQNNPFRTGTELGKFTVNISWTDKPNPPQPNTIYLGNRLGSAAVVYRIHYATDPNDLAGSVPLPTLTIGKSTQTNCPVRPIIVPEDATVWGRLDNTDFTGSVPASKQRATNPPTWTLISSTISNIGYMQAVISREFLDGNTIVVVSLKRPLSPNNRAGQPPYTPSQVRFWSMAEKEPISTASVRSFADADSAAAGGYSVYVISDPSLKPADSILAMWSATWIAWGALVPGDFVYNTVDQKLTSSDGVFYYGLAYYSQTFADPSFTQSIVNVSALPPPRQKAAMGAYWPKIGYCSAASFGALGANCLN